MGTGSLPEDGELQLGSIRLPAGKRLLNYWQTPVAWITATAVPEPGRVWAALSAAQQQTGLVPFLLGGLYGDPRRPWDTAEFESPADLAELARMDAAVVLAGMWDGEMLSDEEEEEEEDEEWVEMRAPFGTEFPGLAPPEQTSLSPERLDEVLGSLPAARMGLVPADRPADVLPLIGWTPSDQSNALPIAAVVRSWEDRFGARLLRIGFAEISLLVDRPPRTVEHAQRVAAEHFVFCDECAGQGLSDISSITASLMQTPIWTFWWD